MTPEEKAQELIAKFKHPVRLKMGQEDVLERAKQCASIAVDEILSILDYFNEQYHYYLEVKQEIEKL